MEHLKPTRPNYGEEPEVEQNPDHPYDTCKTCVVQNRCKRVTEWEDTKEGRVNKHLPDDYLINPSCNGYEIINKAMKLAKIPPEYQTANRDFFLHSEETDVRDRDNINAMLFDADYLTSNASNLGVIHPHKGTGKTYLAVSVLNEYIIQKCMTPDFDFESPLGLYVKFGQWANDNRNIYLLRDEDHTLATFRLNEVMKKVPLLVVDDIGSGRMTDMVRDLFYDIVDYRKENMLSTIFTSNMPMQMLADDTNLGEIIMSRLRYGAEIIHLGGKSRRE